MSMEKSWQHQLSALSLKKRAKFDILRKNVRDLEGLSCLEIGAETGVLADFLKEEKGGDWQMLCLEERWLKTCRELSTGKVRLLEGERLPYESGTFDFILLSRPEHIQHDQQLFEECSRILKRSGNLLVLTPAVGKGLPLNRAKEALGLTMERYGHFRPGYAKTNLARRLALLGLIPIHCCSYSRFFTEGIELLVNALYVRAKGGGHNDYRPAGRAEAEQQGLYERAYRLILPLLKGISLLDRLLVGMPGYVLYIEVGKE